MKRIAVALTLALLASCTQWGTSAFRSVDVWWACNDRATKCSAEDAALTLLQMDNTAAAVLWDLARAEASGRVKAQDVERLRQAVAVMRAARARVSSPPSWGEELQDYVQAVVNSERLAERTYPRLARDR